MEELQQITKSLTVHPHSSTPHGKQHVHPAPTTPTSAWKRSYSYLSPSHNQIRGNTYPNRWNFHTRAYWIHAEICGQASRSRISLHEEEEAENRMLGAKDEGSRELRLLRDTTRGLCRYIFMHNLIVAQCHPYLFPFYFKVLHAVFGSTQPKLPFLEYLLLCGFFDSFLWQSCWSQLDNRDLQMHVTQNHQFLILYDGISRCNLSFLPIRSSLYIDATRATPEFSWLLYQVGPVHHNLSRYPAYPILVPTLSFHSKCNPYARTPIRIFRLAAYLSNMYHRGRKKNVLCNASFPSRILCMYDPITKVVHHATRHLPLVYICLHHVCIPKYLAVRICNAPRSPHEVYLPHLYRSATQFSTPLLARHATRQFLHGNALPLFRFLP